MGYPLYESNRALNAANFNLQDAIYMLQRGIPEPQVVHD